MTTNQQGMTLGQQVRSNPVGAQMTSEGYLNRTQRQINLQQQQAQFNALQKQAEDINSNIKTFDDYKTTYAGLSPQLKQFFKSPDEIQAGISQQQQTDINQVDTDVTNLTAQRDALQQKQQSYEQSSIGQDTASRNAQLFEYDKELNALNVKIATLNQNKTKINEGYSYSSIVDYANQKADYENQVNDYNNSTQSALSQSNQINNNAIKQNNTKLISDFEKANPTEHLHIDKNGNVYAVQSGIFNQILPLNDYNKAIVKFQSAYNDYLHVINNIQHPTKDNVEIVKPENVLNPTPRLSEQISNLLGYGFDTYMLNKDMTKTPTPLSMYFKQATNDVLGFGESTVRGIARGSIEAIQNLPVSPLFSTTGTLKGGTLSGKTPVLTGTTLNKIGNFEDELNAGLVVATTGATLTGMPEVIVPVDTYFLMQGVDNTVKNIEEGNFGHAFTSSLMVLPFASNVVKMYTSNLGGSSADTMTVFNSDIRNAENNVIEKTGNINEISKNDISKVETNAVTKSNEKTTVNKGNFEVKANEEGTMTSGRGGNVRMPEGMVGVNEAITDSMVSMNRAVGDAKLIKGGVTPKDMDVDIGTGVISEAYTKELGKITDAKLMGSDNWIRKVVQFTMDQVKSAKPKFQEMGGILQRIGDEDNINVNEAGETVKKYAYAGGKMERVIVTDKNIEIKSIMKVLNKEVFDEVNADGKNYKMEEVDLNPLQEFINAKAEKQPLGTKFLNELFPKLKETSIPSKQGTENLQQTIDQIFERNRKIEAEMTQGVKEVGRVKKITTVGIINVIEKQIEEQADKGYTKFSPQTTKTPLSETFKEEKTAPEQVSNNIENNILKQKIIKVMKYDEPKVESGVNINKEGNLVMLEKVKETSTTPQSNQANIEKQVMDKFFPEKKSFASKTITTEDVSGESGTIKKQIEEDMKNALKEQIKQKGLTNALKGIQIPNVQPEYSIFGKEGVQPRGQIWKEFAEKSSLGNSAVKSNLPDFFEKTNFTNASKSDINGNNRFFDRVNSRLSQDLNSVLKTKLENGVIQKGNDGLKFSNFPSQIDFVDTGLKSNQGLKMQQLLLQKGEFEGNFAQAPFNEDLNDLTDFSGFGFDFNDLKMQVKKKHKRKVQTIKELDIFPDFSAKALGLAPVKIKASNFNKEYNKIINSIGVKRGAMLI